MSVQPSLLKEVPQVCLCGDCPHKNCEHCGQLYCEFCSDASLYNWFCSEACQKSNKQEAA